MSEENNLAVDLLLNLWNDEVLRLNVGLSQSLLESLIRMGNQNLLSVMFLELSRF